MKTIIAGLVAITLVATAGMALAGSSYFQVDTYTTYGGVWENIWIGPGYMDDEGIL